jgi:hypothetical protein
MRQDLRFRYELDYWGLANLQALKYILENDKMDSIVIKAESNTPIANSLVMLNEQDRNRLIIDNSKKPNYIITNYNYSMEYFGPRITDSKYLDSREFFYEIRVDNNVLLSVFRTSITGKPEIL